MDEFRFEPLLMEVATFHGREQGSDAGSAMGHSYSYLHVRSCPSFRSRHAFLQAAQAEALVYQALQ
jgi:hypothetical protein